MIEPEEIEPNYRAFLFIAIFAGAILFFTYPLIIPHHHVNETINNTTPAPTPIVIIKTVTITPTPDNGIYYAEESETGTRKLARYFHYYRDNATGYKDLSAYVTVYGYKILNSLHFWNMPDNKYYEINPTAGTKFFFAYVQYYTDVVSGDDVRNWLPDERHFFVKYKDKIYTPIAWNQEIRIYELENTATKNGDTYIQYYGQWVKHALWGTEAGKPISVPHYISYGGKSNAIDGYIIFEIPTEAEITDISVIGQFFAFGNAEWVLKR